jgi:hypothetical protein
MAARRRSDSELPHAPLELLHPLLLPGADIPGAEILGELGCTPDATTLLQLYRAVLAWSAHPENSPALDSASLERTEFALLSRGDDPLASPAGLLAGYMAQPEAATQREVAWVCICIADWATERGARATALRFTEAAALAWPRHARYAWMVARMLRAQNKVRESEAWFRRAHRVAVWSDDWEAQARTLNSLGNLNRTTGRIGHAKRLHLRALRVARRFGLKALEGEVCHDLFVVHAASGDREAAETFAAQAFAAYGATHHKLTLLVHDIAQLWTEHGFYWRALPIFQALLRRTDLPYHGIRELAGAGRASGAASDGALFRKYSGQVRVHVPDVPVRVAAAALLEVGLGAECLAEFSNAVDTVREALELAEKCGAGTLISECEVVLARVALCRDVTTVQRGRREIGEGQPGDLLAMEMAQTVARDTHVPGEARARPIASS